MPKRPVQSINANTDALNANLKRTRITTNLPNGFIEKLEMINFMCHEHFSIEFSPNINFLIGKNGSGKSAILTALMICLGGKASETQRGDSVTSFIKGGTDFFKIQITLYNNGSNPYRQNEMGEHIVLERLHRKNSSSTYAIYGLNGKKFGSKKEDIMEICSHFSLKVCNPLVILTQENAKSLLKNSKPSDLYTFFKDGTLLSQIENDYKFAKTSLIECEAQFEGIIQNQSNLKDEISKKHFLLNRLSNLKNISLKIRDLRNHLTWEIVNEKESEYKEILQEFNSDSKSLIEFERKIAKLREDLLILEESSKSKEESFNSNRQESLSKILSEKEALLKNETILGAQITSLEDDKRILESDLERERRKIERINTEFTKFNQDKEEEKEGSFAFLEKNIFLIEEKILNTKSKLDSLQISSIIDEKENIFLEGKERMRIKEGELDQKKKVILDLEKRIKLHDGLKNSKKIHDIEVPKLSFMHASLPIVMEKIFIKKNPSFITAPKPPAIFFLSLQKGEERWELAMEALLGSNMNSWCVDNHSDRDKLLSLLKEHNILNQSVSLVSFKNAMSFSPHQNRLPQGLPSGILKATDILKINDPVVRMMISITTEIDNSILIPDQRDAMSAALENFVNVLNIYSLRAVVSCKGSPSQKQIHDRSLRLREVSMNSRGGDQNLSNLQDDVKTLEKNQKLFHDIQGEFLQLKKEVSYYQSEFLKEKEKIQSLEVRRIRLQNEIDSLGSEKIIINEKILSLPSQESLESNRRDKLNQFSEEKKEITAKCKSLNNQLKSYEENFLEINAEMMNLLKKIKEKNEEIRLNEELENAYIDSLSRKRREISDKKNDIYQLEGTHSSMKKAHLAGIAEKKISSLDELELMTSQAKIICHRPDGKLDLSNYSSNVDKSISYIDNLSQILKENEENLLLREKEIDSIDPTTVTNSLMRLNSELSLLSRDIQINKTLLTSMEIGLENRSAILENMTNAISEMSNTDFVLNLSFRGFNGNLLFDHEKKELILNSSAIQSIDDFRDTKQLSGGEKSYSTSCFLFSLWNSITAPIRCLDEFDVFLDSVNRDMIMELIVNEARKRRESNNPIQLLLITPNVLSAQSPLRDCDDVLLHNLEKPIRNGTE